MGTFQLAPPFHLPLADDPLLRSRQGSWGGKGAKKNKHAKKFITKIAGIAPAARQDANFTNVIISEKKDKKAQKYLLKDLPFPYTSAAQHEHKLRTPMGPEWSTSTVSSVCRESE